jgi:hypothetical protein
MDNKKRKPKKTKTTPNTKISAKTSSPSPLFEIHDLAENAVAEAVAQLLPTKWKENCFQVGHFFLFCHERQMVWEKRNCGDSLPWTQSEALAKYSFCNVSRPLFPL